MSKDVTRSVGEPHSRLTRMCDEMTKTLEAHPEHREDDKCIVFLTDEHVGGLVLHGYDSDSEAIADLFIHLKAMFEANGKKMMLVPLREG